MRLGIGEPLDQWEHELRRISRNGLIDLVDQLLRKLQMLGVSTHRDTLLKLMQGARKNGRIADSHAAMLRRRKDPQGEYERYLKKSQAAKKAARRRKREARKKAA